MWKIKPTHLEHLLPYHVKYQESVQILITMPIFETHLFSYKATKTNKQANKQTLFYGRTDLPSRVGGSIGRFLFLFLWGCLFVCLFVCFVLFLFYFFISGSKNDPKNTKISEKNLAFFVEKFWENTLTFFQKFFRFWSENV